MRKVLIAAALATTLAIPAAAQQADDPLFKTALQKCAGMPNCTILVRTNAFPAEFLVACAQAFNDAQTDKVIKAGDRASCNTAFGEFLKRTARR